MAQNDLELKNIEGSKTGRIHVNVLFFLTYLFSATPENRVLGWTDFCFQSVLMLFHFRFFVGKY